MVLLAYRYKVKFITESLVILFAQLLSLISIGIRYFSNCALRI